MRWAWVEPIEAGLADYIKDAVVKFQQGEDFGYAVWDDHASLLVGGAGLHRRLGPGRLEIGYWVLSGLPRRGIAPAVARPLAVEAFSMSEIEEVHIHCDEANVASAAVPRRLG